MVKMIDLNVTALAILSSLFVRDYKCKQTQLINVSSVGGYFLAPGVVPYCGTKFFVSAGIYMLSPEILDLIPQDEFYDMPTLFEKAIAQDKNVISFPIHEYWIDIGRLEEYQKANEEYAKVF